MRKKFFGLTLSIMLFAPTFPASAQQAKKIPRIGYLGSGGIAPSYSKLSRDHEAFLQGLKELGYIEGKTIRIEYRYAEGKYDRLPDFAAELIHLKVDLIVASGDPAVLAAKGLTKTIPIVFVFVSDPVADGYVTSLAQPGGNLTGLSQLYPELSAKRLELFKETLPKISRLAILFGWLSVNNVKEQERAAQALGIQLVLPPPLRGVGDVEAALA
jgi:putative ABC transport system substrate-binding protein